MVYEGNQLIPLSLIISVVLYGLSNDISSSLATQVVECVYDSALLILLEKKFEISFSFSFSIPLSLTKNKKTK